MAGNLRTTYASVLVMLIAAGCATVDVPAPTAARRIESPVAGDTEKDVSPLALQRAKALRGDANEQFILAGMYERGEGAPQSYDDAAEWYKAAADQGHAAAQFFFGAMHGSGRGVKRDYPAAVMWFGKSAAQGYREALYPMAFAHEYGIGVAANNETAIQWYLKSAEAGVWQAMDRLGKAYQTGELGLTPDADKAKEWFAKAALSKPPVSK